jgi:copper chaperone CopZ
MKKCILLLSLTAFVFAGEKTTNFKVKGMSCKFGCPTKVKTALEGVDGVKLCDVNFETSSTTVTYNDEEILDKDIMKILSEKTDFEILIENKPKEETSRFKKFLSKFFRS